MPPLASEPGLPDAPVRDDAPASSQSAPGASPDDTPAVSWSAPPRPEDPSTPPPRDDTESDSAASEAAGAAEPAEEEPSVEAEPVAEEESVAEEEPSVEDEPVAKEEPVAEEEPSVEDEPAVEDDSAAAAEPEDGEGKRDWYILKVQSNREDSIREALLRRVAVAGLEEYFGDVIVPTEMVSEFRGGKKRVVKRKLYPGYIVVNMVINDDTWFLVRDTPGVGDFTGSGGKPSPMLPHEVSRILVMESDETKEKGPKPKISFRSGDRVKINEGTFENFEGDVDTVDEANGRVTVMINIFGRSTPVELEYWQVESV